MGERSALSKLLVLKPNTVAMPVASILLALMIPNAAVSGVKHGGCLTAHSNTEHKFKRGKAQCATGAPTLGRVF